MNLRERRDRIFAQYQQGRLTDMETQLRFAWLLVEAREEQAAVALCEDLPDWFQTDFLKWLSDIAPLDFRYRWFSFSDGRTMEQIEADADRHQEVLREIGPAILKRLRSEQ